MENHVESLETRYGEYCMRHGVSPNWAISSAFSKADAQKVGNQRDNFVILLDNLTETDIIPLIDIFLEMDACEIQEVDIFQDSTTCISHKLGVIKVQGMSFGKEFLWDLSQRGLACQVLNIRSSRLQRLSMVGSFMQMHTLKLDFSNSLVVLGEECFTCMPNLKCLSLCETRITNLWTTVAALLKLPSLVELCFQNCIFCDENGSSIIVPMGEQNTSSGQPSNDNDQLNIEVRDIVSEVQCTSEEAWNNTEFGFPNSHQEPTVLETSSGVYYGLNRLIDLQHQIFLEAWKMQNEEFSTYSSSTLISSVGTKNYISNHPSPICYEKYYREYMIVSLSNLKVLDNLPITKIEKDRACSIFSQHFEYLAYRRKNRENLTSILHMRELRAKCAKFVNQKLKPHCTLAKSQSFYTRSLSAAKLDASPWPLLHPISVLSSTVGNDNRSFRPRQFEYHPSDPSLMACGTLDGEVVIINHENEKIVCYIPSLGAMNSVLGISWLKKYPSKLIAGSDNGSLKLYDIKDLRDGNSHSISQPETFDEFDQLTSVHVNSTDEWFLASGYSQDVALYDIQTRRRLQIFSDMHRQHINVVKFANHSPYLFATSSFDQDVKMWDLRQKPTNPCYRATSSKGNVMVCFSPDDQYLLVSAVDNEVKQLLAADGRLHLDFKIAPTGSSQNYTRSYYLNGKDYIVSGSCDENVVRVCCAQTGRRLKDVALESKGAGVSMFVQSLRGDPFRDFNMSVLAAYIRPSSNSEIVKVNLLSSAENAKEYSDCEHIRPFYSRGG
ncbi:uncharacterized protein LOC124919581 [Impatiens glandulifera]|uniref:uncharacterized protein LOC124919581 n=1 Tax=Impatiens glandulifera TaxID=253017 RepID=UPI001FB0A1BF|nr:uncharacterized protein LOC124919581 [Impatiens glandulifera]